MTDDTAALDRMVENAQALKPYVKVPLVIGHTEAGSQPERGRMEPPERAVGGGGGTPQAQ